MLWNTTPHVEHSETDFSGAKEPQEEERIKTNKAYLRTEGPNLTHQVSAMITCTYCEILSYNSHG